MTNLETRAGGRIGEDEALADAELLARWCAGNDASAFELLVRRHGGMVLGVCRRVLGNTAEADDAFQATFLVFILKAQTLARPEQAAAWLHAVALRVARKAKAKRARQREREAAIVDTLDPVDPAIPDPVAERRELRQTIDEELDRLPEKYRLPIVLCELEGRTLEEAAQLLGWPKGTVAGRLSRGRELLRKRLSRRGVELPLFMLMPLPALGNITPSEPLVSATLATATGQAGTAAPSAALAKAFLRDRVHRRLGFLAILILAALLLALLGWQTRAAIAGSPPPPPAESGPCHCPTS